MKVDYNDMKNVILVGINGDQYVGKYINARVDRDTIPRGKYVYECRHSDYVRYYKIPITIEYRVVVNFAGTFVTDTQIEFLDENDPFIQVKEMKNV